MEANVKKLVENNTGSLIYFDKEKALVLWNKTNSEEYIINNLVDNEGSYSLQDGNYHDNIEDAMLSFLTRKGKRLSICIGVSEQDSWEIKNGEVFDWTYEDKSGISVDVRITDDETWNNSFCTNADSSNDD